MSGYLVPLDARITGDERGIIYRPEPAPEKVDGLHLAELVPGAVRGNHRHNNSSETVILLGARFRVAAAGSDGEREEKIIGPEPVSFLFPPGVAHAFENVGETPGYLVCFHDSDTEEPDQETVKLIS